MSMGEQGSSTTGASASLGIPLALCAVSGVMAAGVLVPILPELFKEFGGVRNASFWIPALVTIPGLCSAILSPLAGHFGDRIGAKWPIVICLCLYALIGMMPIVLHDFASILISRIGLGIVLVGVLMLSIVLIGQQFDGVARDRWLGMQAVAVTASGLVLLPASGFLAESTMGWRGSFLLFLSAFALALFLALQPVRSHRHAHSEAEGAPTGLPWRWLLGQCLVTIVVGVLLFSTQFQVGLALSTVGVRDVGTIGLLSGIAVVGLLLGSLSFMPARRLLGRAALGFEMAACGVTLLLMWQFQWVAALVVLAFINLFACGLMLPTLITTVAGGLPHHVRGRGMGVWNSAFTAAQFVSSALIGIVLGHRGATVLDAFGLLGVVALVMAAGIVLASRRQRDPGTVGASAAAV